MSCGPKLLYEWTIAGYIVRIEETEPGIVRFVQGRCDASLPPSIMDFEPTEKPIGAANEIIHLAKALEQQREATKEAWRAAALRAWYDCIDCGSHIKVDEDGCCATCGRDADFIDLDYVQRRMTTMERENEELRSEIAALRADLKWFRDREEFTINREAELRVEWADQRAEIAALREAVRWIETGIGGHLNEWRNRPSVRRAIGARP